MKRCKALVLAHDIAMNKADPFTVAAGKLVACGRLVTDQPGHLGAMLRNRHRYGTALLDRQNEETGKIMPESCQSFEINLNKT
jgi:hypothetical protein